MHRIIGGDGYKQCFACGTVVERVSDGDTDEPFRYVDCRPGGWQHPPYIMGIVDGAPYVETCAAHPYSGCTIDAAMEASNGAVQKGIVEAVEHGHPDWSHAMAYGPCSL